MFVKVHVRGFEGEVSSAILDVAGAVPPCWREASRLSVAERGAGRARSWRGVRTGAYVGDAAARAFSRARARVCFVL